MEKVRRILTLILAVTAMLGTLSAAAAEEEPAFVVETAVGKAGEQVEIAVRIENSPGITAARMQISFDEGLILNDVSGGDMGVGLFMGPQTLSSPFYIIWTYGTGNVSGDALFAKLTFSVKENAEPGLHQITVAYDADDVYSVDMTTYAETNVAFGVVNGGVQVEESNDSCSHRYAPYISNGDAGCTEDGTKSAVCELCGNVDTLPDEGSAPGHDFSRRTQSNDYLVQGTGTDCASVKEYYFACSRCDAVGEGTYRGTSAGSHAVGSGWYWENGAHFRKCSVSGCGYREDYALCSGEGTLCAVCGNALAEVAAEETENSPTEQIAEETDYGDKGRGLLIAAAAALILALILCGILVLREIRKKR